MMLLFNFVPLVFKLVKALWPPLGALAFSILLGIPYLYGFVPVWVSAVLLTFILGLFSKNELRAVLVWHAVCLGVLAWMSIKAGFGLDVVAHVLPGACFLGLVAAQFILERYKGGEIESRLDAWWTKLTTGKKHKEATHTDVDGSARMRTPADMEKAKRFNATGEDEAGREVPRIPLGLACDERDEEKFNGEKGKFNGLAAKAKMLYAEPICNFHTFTMAGTGGGKSTGVVIPALLTFSNGVLVHDVKGELRDSCAPAREAKFGTRAVWIDTSEPDGRWPESYSFDMLEWLSIGKGMIGDCDNAAAFLITEPPSKGGEGENFFITPARRIVSGYLGFRMRRHKLHGDPRPKVTDLTDVLFAPSEQTQQLFQEIVAEMRDDAANASLASEDRDSAKDIINKLAKFTETQDLEMWDKTISTLQKEMNWLTDSRIAKLVSAGTAAEHVFSLEDLFSGKLDIYVCLKAEDLQNKAAVARSIVGSILSYILREKERLKNAGGMLAVLDEMPRLGNLTILHSTALELARGCGLSIWGIIQSPQGLIDAAGEGAFKKWMDNCDVVQVFKLGDKDTNEYISSLLGEKTVQVVNTNHGAGGGRTKGDQESVTTKARKLMTLDEVRRLPKHLMLTLVTGEDPFIAGKPSYYLIREFYETVQRYKLQKSEVVTPSAKELAAYRRALEEVVAELFGPAQGDITDAYGKMVAKMLEVGAKRPDLFPAELPVPANLNAEAEGEKVA